MPNIYVDLSSTGTGHSGTQQDPYSYTDWNASISSGDTYYLKGSIDPPTDFLHDGVSFNIWAWDIVQYGPWRIGSNARNKTFRASGANVSDGILFVQNFSLGYINHVYIDYAGSSADFYSNIVNSTIIMGSQAQTNATASIDRCAIKSNGNNFFTLVGSVTISNIVTESAPGLFTGSVIPGPNLNYNQTFTTNPSEIDADKLDFNLKTYYGVGETGGWAYIDPGVYIGQYNPITMNLESNDVTGIDFGDVIQGNHCSRTFVLKPTTRQGINLNALAMFLEDNGGLENTSFGKFKSNIPISRIGPGSPYLSDDFTQVTGISDYSLVSGVSDQGLILNPNSPEYVWLDMEVGMTDNTGSTNINYRFLFEYD